MANSRQRLKDEKPTNTSKGKGLILETPYHPGFVDDKDLETVKMAIDKELADISNAFYQTTERTADTITRIDNLEISGETDYGKLEAQIKEVDKVSKEGDEALAQRVTTITAAVGENKAAIETESTARANQDEVLAKQITSVKAELDGQIAEVKQYTEVQIGSLDGKISKEEADRLAGEAVLSGKITQEEADRLVQQGILDGKITTVDGKVETINAKWGVTVDVNGNVAGIELNNGTKGSEFKVLADRFYFTDGKQTIPPFAVVGNTVHMSNVVIRGTLYAEDLQGDLGTEVTFVPPAFFSFTNAWERWYQLTIPNARPYTRELVLDGSYFYQHTNSSHIVDIWIEARPGSGGFLGQSNVIGVLGAPMPIKVWIQIPAGFSGPIVLYVKSNGAGVAGLMQGVTSARMFKLSNEAIYNG